MAQVVKSIDVDAPVSVCYGQWGDFESFPQFLEFVTDLRMLSETMTRWTVRIGGSEHTFDAEIVERRPDARIAWQGVGAGSQAGVVTLEPLGDAATRVTVRFDWAPRGFAEKAASLAGLDARMIEKSLGDFKRHVERRTPSV